MPINKNAYFRYKVIDNCLRNSQRKYNVESLLEAVSEAVKYELSIDKGISRRTLFLDLKQMQQEPPDGFGAPIDLNLDNHYFYTDPNFSITNCPLVEEDADKLHEALAILKQFSGFPQFEGIENIIKKLELKSGLKGKLGKPIIEFEKIENSRGLNYLETIYNSINKDRVLKIDYRPFHHDNSRMIILHPYIIKEFNNRWFVFGLNHKLNKITTLALDRIEDINPSDEPFIENTYFSSADYFRNIIGVSVPIENKNQIIKAKIKKPRGNYVSTKPIHHSQKLIKETKSHLLFEWKLILNQELISLLLSFGDDLTILKPLILREEIKDKLQKAIINYSN